MNLVSRCVRATTFKFLANFYLIPNIQDGATPGGSSSTDPFESLLSQLSAAGLGEGGEGGEGGENEEELQGMLEMMMNSLMSKEVLYEPLKELGDKVRLLPSLPLHSNPMLIDCDVVPRLCKNTLRNPLTRR